MVRRFLCRTPAGFVLESKGPVGHLQNEVACRGRTAAAHMVYKTKLSPTAVRQPLKNLSLGSRPACAAQCVWVSKQDTVVAGS